MTDFLGWWADHWPLLVVAGPILALYPIWVHEVQLAWQAWAMRRGWE